VAIEGRALVCQDLNGPQFGAWQLTNSMRVGF
jgi:hypothetical protein